MPLSVAVYVNGLHTTRKLGKSAKERVPFEEVEAVHRQGTRVAQNQNAPPKLFLPPGNVVMVLKVAKA